MFNGFILNKMAHLMAILRIFLFNKAFYLKEINLQLQKKIFSKGCRNGKVCYFLPLLFSCYSAFPHPPTLAEEEPLPNDVLASLPWQELRNQQEGNKDIWESQVGLSSNHIS